MFKKTKVLVTKSKKQKKWPFVLTASLLLLPLTNYFFAHAASFTSGSFTFTGTSSGNTPWTNSSWQSVTTNSGIENITIVGNTTAPTLEVQDPQVNGNFSSGSYLFTQATNFG